MVKLPKDILKYKRYKNYENFRDVIYNDMELLIENTHYNVYSYWSQGASHMEEFKDILKDNDLIPFVYKHIGLGQKTIIKIFGTEETAKRFIKNIIKMIIYDWYKPVEDKYIIKPFFIDNKDHILKVDHTGTTKYIKENKEDKQCNINNTTAKN